MNKVTISYHAVHTARVRLDLKGDAIDVLASVIGRHEWQTSRSPRQVLEEIQDRGGFWDETGKTGITMAFVPFHQIISIAVEVAP